MFSNAQIYGQLALGMACILIPLTGMVYLNIRKNAEIKYAVAGAVVFFSFALVLEKMLHVVVLPLIDQEKQTWLYVLYGALAAGIFEEIPRYYVLKVMDKKKSLGTYDALQYGLGHGGFEMTILVGLTGISHFFLERKVNALGLSAILKDIPPAYHGQVKESIQALASIQGVQVILPLVERILALSFHLAMALLAYFIVRGFLKKSALVLAVGLHFLMDLPAMLFQVGLVKSLPAIYVGYLVMVLAIFYWLSRVYRKETRGILQEDKGGDDDHDHGSI
ncbi:MAG: YhfC family intramembrane metalloprotease [Peptoniphilus sp. oral taxon 375]|nr:YhfC family intramembrane metalloprotease [Peptoniphilus sp. oral taxon 375]